MSDYCSRPEMAVARQEVCLRRVVQNPAPIRDPTVSTLAINYAAASPGIEYTYLDEKAGACEPP